MEMRGRLRHVGDAHRARKLVFLVMGVCAVCVVGAVVASYVWEPEKVARRKFERMAVEYYEDYFYPKFIEEVATERLEERMNFYSRVGVQDVTLQQVLAYNMGMNRGETRWFERKGFSCDKKGTYAKFFPEEPFEANNYHVEFYYKCQEGE